jgi:predicted ATPase/DNA-binding SARP family transcriptional activator
MSETLEIRVLGPFEVWRNGQPANISGSKRHALLALLALRRGRVVGVDALVDALWGEDLPAAPRNALQHHVARLRAALGAEVITAAPDGYALGAEAAVDALQFEELLAEARAALREGDSRAAARGARSALALWRGPALHGLTDTAWFRAEAERLDALRTDALEEHFEAALALGEHREIVSALRAALEEAPFRERLWGQLMLALYRSGRQADSLETFREARRVLTEELALEPGPELQRLQAAILAHDPAIAPAPVVERPHGNLPTPSSSFVGREHELARVSELLREHRLVTLTGPPGVGKSRLALEVARSLDGDLAGGAWLVEFARSSGEEGAVRLLADALDARGADPLERVAARLRDAAALVVLDGCEHVLEEASEITASLVARCPLVRVLATSRTVLHVTGEARVYVEPLPVPDTESAETLESPAVQLFVERARAARPGFQVSGEAAPLVAEITRRVDGLPFAIELAAARVNVLGLGELLSVVERRLALRDRPAADPGRAGLQRLVEWSYDLLHGDEQTLLQQLAVHRGGASLQSLITLGAEHGLDETTVTYLLEALVDKSIVSVSFAGDAARYDLLDTVREYVLALLAERGALVATRKAHAEYFASLADAAWGGLRSPDWLAWTKRVAPENDNLWAALAYASETPDPGIAIRLGKLGWYHALTERVSDGRRFLELALAAAPDGVADDARFELLGYVCYLATEELDLPAAIEVGERGIALGSGGDAPPSIGLVQIALALALALAGENERAAALVEEAIASARAGADDWTIAATALVGAIMAAGWGNVATVADLTAELMRHSDAIGFDPWRVPGLLLEGWVADRRTHVEAAGDTYGRAFELAGRIDMPDHAAFALARLAAHAFAGGDLRRAEELQREALEIAEASESPWTAAHVRVELGRVLAASDETDAAERLFRNVVEWSQKERLHQGRESLFVALVGDPAGQALLGLAEIAEARGDTGSADDLRARARLAPA